MQSTVSSHIRQEFYAVCFSYLSRSKNFKILEIGQVMILRKGKPCVVMPVTGSGKGFVPDDSKPLSGHIHAGRHASNLALQCISPTFSDSWLQPRRNGARVAYICDC